MPKMNSRDKLARLLNVPPTMQCERMVLALWWPEAEETVLRQEARALFQSIVKGAS